MAAENRGGVTGHFQGAVIYHDLGTCIFLVWLEKKDDGAGNFVPVRSEDLCFSKEHGRMSVVAAGVRDARRLRRKSFAAFFEYGKRVDIHSDHGRLAGLSAL